MDRKKIENTLLNIGIPANVKGFKYIADAVMYIDEFGLKSITRKIYPAISEKNRTNAASVERCIRHALKVGKGEHCNKTLSKHYIGNENDTNSSSLALLHLRLKEDVSKEKNEWAENVHNLKVEWNGWRFLVVYGKGPDGWFLAIPNCEICVEIAQPDDVKYNSEKLKAHIGIDGAGTVVAEEIRKAWEES